VLSALGALSAPVYTTIATFFDAIAMVIEPAPIADVLASFPVLTTALAVLGAAATFAALFAGGEYLHAAVRKEPLELPWSVLLALLGTIGTYGVCVFVLPSAAMHVTMALFGVAAVLYGALIFSAFLHRRLVGAFPSPSSAYSSKQVPTLVLISNLLSPQPTAVAVVWMTTALLLVGLGVTPLPSSQEHSALLVPFAAIGCIAVLVGLTLALKSIVLLWEKIFKPEHAYYTFVDKTADIESHAASAPQSAKPGRSSSQTGQQASLLKKQGTGAKLSHVGPKARRTELPRMTCGERMASCGWSVRDGVNHALSQLSAFKRASTKPESYVACFWASVKVTRRWAQASWKAVVVGCERCGTCMAPCTKPLRDWLDDRMDAAIERWPAAAVVLNTMAFRSHRAAPREDGMDVYAAFASEGALRRAIHVWERHKDRVIAQKAEFRNRMSGVFGRSGMSLEGTSPVMHVNKQGGRLGSKHIYKPAGQLHEYEALTDEDRKAREERVRKFRAAEAAAIKEAEENARRLWMSLRMWRWYRVWRVRAEERGRKQQVVRGILSRFQLGETGRLYSRGIHAFRCLTPFWDPALAAPAVSISKDLYWADSSEHLQRAAAHGASVFKQGVHRFCFRVSGGGQGVVVGVSDASKPGQPPDESWGWGLHMTHGALYTKTGKGDRGTLSTKQLVGDILAISEDGEPLLNIVDIEVEVNMGTRRIAFALADGPLIQAPVVLTAAVRPWAYFWSDSDAVAFVGLPQRKVSKMSAQSPSSRGRTPLKSPAPLPLRMTSARSPSRSPTRSSPPLSTSPGSPGSLQSKKYLPIFITAGEGQKDYPSSRLLFGGRAVMSRTLPEPPGAKHTSFADEAQIGGGATDDNPGPWSPGPCSPGPRSPGRSPPRSPREKSPRTSRGRARSHMWDMVRHVTQVYSDLPKQLNPRADGPKGHNERMMERGLHHLVTSHQDAEEEEEEEEKGEAALEAGGPEAAPPAPAAAEYQS